MLHHYLFSLTVLAVLALFSVGGSNQPTLVTLRIVGSMKTIFEGTIQVATTGHNVTTASGGNHHYDGTNNGANPLFLVPLVPVRWTTHPNYLRIFSLLMGMFWVIFDFKLRKMMANPLLKIALVHFLLHLMISSWCTSIGGDTQTSSKFWSILVNFEFTPVWGLPTISQTKRWGLVCVRCF